MAYQELVIPPLPSAASKYATTYAGFWIRACAYFIDSLLISTTTSIVLPLLPPTLQIVVLLGTLCYFPLLWSRLGGSSTLGMRAFSLHVVGSDGQPISLPRAFVRALVLPFCFFLLYLGVAWVAFDSRKQGWHDKVAGTFVIRH